MEASLAILAANEVDESVVDVGPAREKETASRAQLVEEKQLLVLDGRGGGGGEREGGEGRGEGGERGGEREEGERGGERKRWRKEGVKERGKKGRREGGEREAARISVHVCLKNTSWSFDSWSDCYLLFQSFDGLSWQPLLENVSTLSTGTLAHSITTHLSSLPPSLPLPLSPPTCLESGKDIP